jgi:hypothetical protein
MYNESSLVHIATTNVSLATSLNTLSPKHKIMALTALSFISIFSAGVKVAGINVSPLNTLLLD